MIKKFNKRLNGNDAEVGVSPFVLNLKKEKKEKRGGGISTYKHFKKRTLFKKRTKKRSDKGINLLEKKDGLIIVFSKTFFKLIKN